MAFSTDPQAFEIIHDFAPPRELKGTVYILGIKYELPRDKEAMMEDVQSRIWCTYRRNFRCISGTSLTSDSGWGCTLRCGQMLLAHALLCKHFGRMDKSSCDEGEKVHASYCGQRVIQPEEVAALFRAVISDQACSSARLVQDCDSSADEVNQGNSEDFMRPSEHNVDRYNMILHKFLDIRGSEYSIQMIALQGADFGRSVGQWFGPNNVAQAIKKLAAYDVQSQLAVHVCMDMLVVIDDLKATARECHELPDGLVNVTDERGETINLNRCRSLTELVDSSPDISNTSPSCKRSSSFCPDPGISEEGSPHQRKPLSGPLKSSSPFLLKTSASVADTKASCTGVTCLDPPLCFNNTKHLVMRDESLDFMKLSIRGDSTITSPSPSSTSTGLSALREELIDVKKETSSFRSLLIFIPLRLGQDKFNELYTKSLKDCLTLPQSVGFIGGRPRHALYFIGFNENDLLYLDPHTTQQTVLPRPDGSVPDSTYHCSSCSRMPIMALDPSIALGFFCKDEEDLDNLVYQLRKVVLGDSKLSLFELTEHRPDYWGPQVDSILNASVREPFILVDGESDLEDFEIIEWPVMSPTFEARFHPQELQRSPPLRGLSINSDSRGNSK